MKIDRSKLKIGIWYEDENGNYLEAENATITPPEGARTRHVCFPLEIREEIYLVRHDNGEPVDKEIANKPALVGCTHIGGDGSQILKMAACGDFTLKEALAVYANACERCANALLWKYSNGEDGYPEFSEEWYRVNTVCDFCRGEG